MTIEQVTDRAEWSTSKLVRIENGQVGISKADLNELLAIYGIDKDSEFGIELAELARASKQRMWWSRHQRQLSASYTEFIGSEFDASRIVYFQPLIVPGILQTAEYAFHINRLVGPKSLSDEEISQQVGVRMQRRGELLGRAEPPEIVAVIDEAVLRRTIVDADITLGQLEQLIADSASEGGPVLLTVIPFAAGPHFGMSGPFTIFDYPNPQDDDVVYVENSVGGLMLRDQPEVVEEYQRAVTRLADIGVSGAEAVSFIRAVKKELESAFRAGAKASG